jgi:hypothetical protein
MRGFHIRVLIFPSPIQKYTHSFAHSRSWALLEKPPIVQVLNNFPAFFGTRRFIAVFTRALHLSLSWARSIQSIPSHPISLRSILILSTHLYPTSISLLPIREVIHCTKFSRSTGRVNVLQCNWWYDFLIHEDKKTKLRGFSPQANYTDRATAACRWR